MRKISLIICSVFLLFSCINKSKEETKKEVSKEEKLLISKTLIKNVESWYNKMPMPNLLPFAVDQNGYCVGIDFDIMKKTSEEMKKTNYFTKDFVLNYEQILKKIDTNIKNKTILPWKPNEEIGSINFATNNNPFCNCQDSPENSDIRIELIKEHEGIFDLYWTWTDPIYKDFKYNFSVAFEDNHWKIVNMQGFDINKVLD